MTVSGEDAVQNSMMEALQQENRDLREQLHQLKHERDALQARYQWMEAMLQQSHIPICFWSGADQMYVFANQAYLTRTAKPDAIGKPLRQVFAEDEVPGLMDLVERCYREGETQIIPEAFVWLENEETGEREELWYNLIHNPVRNAEGDVMGVSLFAMDVTKQVRLAKQFHIFHALVENAADGIGVAKSDGTITYANPAYRQMLLYGNELVGSNILDSYAEPAEKMMALVQHVTESGYWQGELTYQRKDGSTFPGMLSAFSISNPAGQVQAVAGIVHDVTEQRRQEAERTSFQQQLIEVQRQALRELSTPLIPISDDVVIMPLIGTIDSNRAQMVMETLLEGIAHYQAELVIIDITGVIVVDTQVAQTFIQAAQAVKLLGARVMLTGIQPQIAQTLVHLGVDLSTIETRGSLQAGITAALQHEFRS
ncbi:MAG: PAS domain-containing protein [Chloroflexaceae bacterium]|nr:PAS domain-containing protein [Chloroflexaceae bacterium]